MNVLVRLPLAIAAGAGLALGRQRPEHQPLGRALAWMLAADLARTGAAALLASPARPRHGLPLAAWGLDAALLASWYAAETWAVWRTLGRHSGPLGSPWPALGAVAAGAAASAAAYPVLHGQPYEAGAAAGFALCALVQAGAALSFAVRRPAVRASQLVALVIAISTVADAAATLAARHLGLAYLWPVVRLGSAVTWIAVSGVELWILARPAR
jgi:hypothetical protein